jgi:uncharacterized OB-fold protein
MKLDFVPVSRKRPYPPRISDFTSQFWDGLANGEWRTTRCRDCAKFTFPPKPVCPHCWSEAMDWQALSNRGTLYSWTRIHAAPRVFRDEAPYVVCIVDLDIELRIACRLLETTSLEPMIGNPVEVVVLEYEDGPLFACRSIDQSA